MSPLKAVSQVLCAIGLALVAVSALAQSYGPNINIETAKKIGAGAVAECQSNKWKSAIAVVDTHGSLVYFERIDDTQIVSLRIAIDKAVAAAIYRRPTRAFADAIAKGGPAVMNLPSVVVFAGGVPIVSDGKIIGAVGVSGGTADQDEQCAKAGLAAM